MRKKELMISAVVVSLFFVIMSITDPTTISPKFSPEGICVYIFTIILYIYFLYKLRNSDLKVSGFIYLFIFTFFFYILSLVVISLSSNARNKSDLFIVLCIFSWISVSNINLIFKKEMVKNNKQKNDNIKNSNSVLYTRMILGLKEIPIHTIITLKNNINDKQIILNYKINKLNKKITLSYNKIENITYKSDVKMKKISANLDRKTELDMGASSDIGVRFGKSNVYEKIDYDPYYTITIDAIHNKKEVKFILETESNPEEFIKKLKKDSI